VVYSRAFSFAKEKAGSVQAATDARTAGAHAIPREAIAMPMPPGITTPPTIEAGNTHDVARESPGLSLASQAMPVGKIGAMAKPVTMYASCPAAPNHAHTCAAAA